VFHSQAHQQVVSRSFPSPLSLCFDNTVYRTLLLYIRKRCPYMLRRIQVLSCRLQPYIQLVHISQTLFHYYVLLYNNFHLFHNHMAQHNNKPGSVILIPIPQSDLIGTGSAGFSQPDKEINVNKTTTIFLMIKVSSKCTSF
jgi:hypothetical protein